jgi:hypothetical protein
LIEDIITGISRALGHRAQRNAQAVDFLASDEVAFTVGSGFVIDGGMTNL